MGFQKEAGSQLWVGQVALYGFVGYAGKLLKVSW